MGWRAGADRPEGKAPTAIQAGGSILWGSLEGLHRRAGGLTRVQGLIAAHFVRRPVSGSQFHLGTGQTLRV